MQAFSELVPPTAVTNAVSLPFLSQGTTNLIVTKTSLLQIFNLKTSDDKSDQGSRLSLVGEYPLSGTITSLARVRAANTKSGGEALLVSSKDAKVSLLEWDPENHRISTISIHYYEGSNIPRAPFEPQASDFASKLIVDPRSRCAALRFAARHLAIIPFRQPEDDIVGGSDGFLEDEMEKPAKVNGETNRESEDTSITPYAASFVLPLTTLDPALTHVKDMMFLHEYREPTFGVIAANKSTSVSLLEERKDLLSYTVITLDLVLKASTSLLSVKNLPSDTWRIVPLAAPIGGALLLGINQLVHIDQSGKTNAVAVNEFARQCTNFSMVDQSGLNLRLENCCIETLNADTGDMLIVPANGRLHILSFKIDGRTVSAISLHPVDDLHGGVIAPSNATATATLSRNAIFIGSDTSDSAVIRWTAQTQQVTKKRSHAQMLGDDIGLDFDEADLEDMEDDAEDDIYGDDFSKSTMHRISKAVLPGSYVFQPLHRLACIGPIHSAAFGRTPRKRAKLDRTPLDMLATTARGKDAKLLRLTRSLHPQVSCEQSDSQISGIFTFNIPLEGSEPAQYCVICRIEADGKETSKLAQITEDSPTEQSPWNDIDGNDFECEGRTLNIFTLDDARKTIHVRESEIRTYDSDFGLSQILPILDPETDEELQVTHAAFSSPYLALVRSDQSVQVLKADASGELEEIDSSDAVRSKKWSSVSLGKGLEADDNLCFLLSIDGGLEIFELPSLANPAYRAPNLAALPAVLTTEDRQRRAAHRDSLIEILYANLGMDGIYSQYLTIRCASDEIVLYEPFHFDQSSAAGDRRFCAGLRFRKVPGLHLPRYDEDRPSLKQSAMQAVHTKDGLNAVLIPGESPACIVKKSSGLPHVVDIALPPLSFLAQFGDHTSGRVVFKDAAGTLSHARLDLQDLEIVGGVLAKHLNALPENCQVHDISYHSDRDLFAIVTSTSMDFWLPSEEQHESDKDIAMRPHTEQFNILLFHLPTASIIDTYQLPPDEIVTSITVAPLEVSEETHNLEMLFAAGTITRRADSYADKGATYLWSIIDVVPKPDQPETGHKLRLVSREEIKAGITATTGIAGLLGTAQGQKIMFRGLREDGQTLPVAFLDAQTYTTSLKTLEGSNLWLAGDYFKGVLFGGFTEEPPRISIFGRSLPPRGAVVDAEFLPHGAEDGGLSIITSDERESLHIWQFDPENPKSLGGTRLIHKGSFYVGHLVTKMMLLPNTTARNEEGEVEEAWQVLTLSTSGQIGLVTPLGEARYRRLVALQGQLVNVLEHPGGLNPKAYRNVKSEDGTGRGMIDGMLLARIGELGAGRRNELVGRVAGEGGWWEVKSDLEMLAGRGLDYF